MRWPRPIAVTLAGWLFIAAGSIGLIYHAGELLPPSGPTAGAFGVALIRVLAILSGVFLLRGARWARWLALAWLAYHVALSALHSPLELAVHAAFLALVAWALLAPAASAYFAARQPLPAGPTPPGG